jgi:uncharacterized protein YkwD
VAGQRRAPLAPHVAGRRRLGLAVAVLAVLTVLATVVTPALVQPGGLFRAEPAEASDAAATLVAKLNAARAGQGLAPLSTASDLTAVAAERAQIMARSGSLSHTPDLGSRVCCWSWLAENAAYAGSADGIHSALMGSAPHRANILYADADDVGVAVVNANGTLWAAQVFRARSDGGYDRSGAASGASRSGERSSTTTSVIPDSDGVVTTSGGPSPAEIARRELQQRLHNLRQNMKAAKHRNGPFDPVRAAVRYAGTLDRVSRD